jgi:hypothetical protein
LFGGEMLCHAKDESVHLVKQDSVWGTFLFGSRQKVNPMLWGMMIS